jgi:uncharacterized membrane protein
MLRLVVLGVEDRDTAEGILAEAGSLARKDLLELDDAACAWKDDSGRLHVEQTFNPTRAGATRGALWGTLIGLITLNPLAGMAVGAATGAVVGKLTDVGISDDMVRQIGSELDDGRAAVFLLARSTAVDRVVDAFKPYRPTVIHTNLSRSGEEELVRALQE